MAMIGVSTKMFVHSLGVSFGVDVTWVCVSMNVSIVMYDHVYVVGKVQLDGLR